MPRGLRRFPRARCLHFITFSCYRREPRLSTAKARDTFEYELERVRKWYGLCVVGYVVMPEHVHLLVGEPERKSLPIAVQMLKQTVSRKMGPGQFWQVRYYDFLVWDAKTRVEKLRYMHHNPVKRGLVERPEQWRWSSFNHYATGSEKTVEIESEWTARRRARMGITLRAANFAGTHPIAPKAGAIRVGHQRGKESLTRKGGPAPEAIVVPSGATGPTATRAASMQFTGGSGGAQGLTPQGQPFSSQVTGVRVMDANASQGPRVVYMNQAGQTVNPNNGRTVAGSDATAHHPLQ